MISVIIPTLDEEKYIKATVDSLHNQDYDGDYEIIVSDSDSDDNTIDLIRDSVNKVVNAGRGVSKARNAGAMEAEGDILLFIDADTSLLYNGIRSFENAFNDKEVVAATCNVIPLSPNLEDFLPYWAFTQFVKQSIKMGNPKLPGLCMGCRKSEFMEINGFDERLGTGEDFDFSSRISKLGKIKFIDETFVMTSPRRIKKWGLLKGFGKFSKIFIKNHILNDNVSYDEYEHIR